MLWIARHHPDARDTVRDKESKQRTAINLFVTDVDVHVPKTGNQKLARGINHAHVPGHTHSSGLAELNYAAARNDQRHVELSRRTIGVDQRDVRDGKLWLRRRGRRQQQTEEQTAKS